MSEGATYVVDGGGSGNFLTIQEGIDAAQYGDSVVVLPGIYSDILIVDAPWGDRIANVSMKDGVVVFSSQGPVATVIDGDGIADYGVWFPEGSSSETVLSGFHIRGGSVGIYMYWSDAHVTGNLLTHHDNEAISNNRGSPLIKSNTIHGPDFGIRSHYDEAHPTIALNIVAYGSGNGIECDEGGGTIYSNNVCGFRNNWWGCTADPLNVYSAPNFCDPWPTGEGGDYTLAANSPCLPENSPSGELIGALGVGCDSLSVGACCFDDGQCFMRTEVFCTNFDNFYVGDGVQCNSDLCSTAPGACCLPDETCVVVSEDECEDLDGDFLGHAVSCDDEICDADAYHVPGDFATIQEAIDAAADLDTIYVAPGVYKGDGNKNLNINRKEILIISEAGPESTVIDCEGAGRGAYFRYVAWPTLLQGFTIKNGVAEFGGAIACRTASPTVRDCILIGNYAEQRGGAISCYGGAARIEHCVISGNLAEWSGGGGIAAYDGADPVIDHCTISGNFGPSGGGVYVGYEWGGARLRHTIVWGNCSDSEWQEVRGTGTYGPVWLECTCIPDGGVGGYGLEVIWLEGNIHEDPRFCDPDTCANSPTTAGDYSLHIDSPCLPGNYPGDHYCGIIGARGYGGCDPGVDVVVEELKLPPGLAVSPNPSHGPIHVAFTTDGSKPRRLLVFDVMGREVYSHTLAPTSGVWRWNGINNAHLSVSPGTYFVRLEAGGMTETKRVVLLR